jgi:plasmid stabilization system protein ParE
MPRSPWLLLIACAAGCADSYTVEDYWRELATAHCERMRECCIPYEYDDWWTGSNGTQDCQVVWQTPPDSDDVRTAIDHHLVAFDPVAARACVDALRAQACSEFEPAYRYHASYCESPLRGLVADGARCEASAECASTRCVFDADSHGTCAPTAGHGEECGNGVGCRLPDLCHGTCQPGLPAGSSCQIDDECADDWCQGTGLFTRGTCVRACDGWKAEAH